MSATRTCPSCKSPQVERAHRRPAERLLSFVRIMPYRCNECDRRFLSFSVKPRPDTATISPRRPIV